MSTFLINCSKAKTIPSNERQGSLEGLAFHNELGSLRVKLLKLNPQIKLCWEKTLPAWELYRGKVFKKVTDENWQKTNANILILSALFGWIRHSDLIPYYDVSMNHIVQVKSQKIREFWSDSDCLSDLIPVDSVDLLSIQYRKSINKSNSFVGVNPQLYWRDKYGSHKGEWLNQQLNSK